MYWEREISGAERHYPDVKLTWAISPWQNASVDPRSRHWERSRLLILNAEGGWKAKAGVSCLVACWFCKNPKFKDCTSQRPNQQISDIVFSGSTHCDISLQIGILDWTDKLFLLTNYTVVSGWAVDTTHTPRANSKSASWIRVSVYRVSGYGCPRIFCNQNMSIPYPHRQQTYLWILRLLTRWSRTGGYQGASPYPPVKDSAG